MTTGNKAGQYLEVQVQTASKEQLLLMLYDGAIRFAEQARVRIEAQDIEGGHNQLIRAKAIVVELMCSLDKRVGDVIYNNLMGLYNFIYMRLVEANFRKEVRAVDDALEILRSLRETWSQAIEKNAKENGQTYVKQTSSLSIQG